MFQDKVASLNKQLSEAKSQVLTLSQKCEDLQIEKEKALKEGASLHLSLQKVI
jgi:hypothetical protein